MPVEGIYIVGIAGTGLVNKAGFKEKRNSRTGGGDPENGSIDPGTDAIDGPAGAGVGRRSFFRMKRKSQRQQNEETPGLFSHPVWDTRAGLLVTGKSQALLILDAD